MRTYSRTAVLAGVSAALVAPFALLAPAVAAPAQPAGEFGIQAISRAKVVERAQTWVAAKVKYNAKGTRDGYRTDCSGYVSMAWWLGPGGQKSTRTLPSVSTRIAKNSLAAGDILLGSGHTLIFHKWANAGKTQYWGYDMSTSNGAVHRAIPYPYWDGMQLAPYRFKNIA